MTTRYLELTTHWQEIASTPCLIEARTDLVRVHFSLNAPDHETKAYHVLNAVHDRSMSYGGTKKTWARAAYYTAALVVTDTADSDSGEAA